MQASDYKKTDLEELIKSYMGVEKITPMIKKQITRYVLQEDMTYLEIARCISWYVETAGQSLSPLYGLWFVPNIREQAAAYFKKLELDQQKQAKEAEKIVEYQDNNIIFNIKSLKHNKRKPKQLDISDIDIKGEDND